MSRPRRFATRLIAATLALAALLSVPAAAPSPASPAGAQVEAPPAQDPRALTYAPLKIRFPEPARVMLPNGLLVYLFEDHELPLVDLVFYLKSGSIYDPADKVGLASLATTLMRTGGTRAQSPDQVDETLDFMPASVQVAAEADAVSGGVSALRTNFPEALKIFAAILKEPRFDAERLAIEKARAQEDLRRRWDDPGTIAELNFRLLAYGARSPWARLETAASIEAITRADLVEWHRRYIHPNNAVLGIAGDFETGAMKTLLRETLGSWPQAKVTPPPVPKVKDEVPAGVHLIRRPLAQSSVEIGHLGINRFAPDKFPVKVLNFILGEGGFTSRLMKEVRSTRGLAYGVGGGVGIDSDRGLFQISCRTKAPSTIEAIRVIRDIVTRLRDEGPTEQEVREAKEASLNAFAFSVDGTVPYMQSYLYYDFYGYPRDYLATYRDNLAKVTREQVAAAGRAHLKPDRMVILIVGDETKFAEPPSALQLGAPRVITLDAAPAEEPAAAPAGR